ncbi:hypothetical protein D3C75_962870 [compost metagenome]
MGGSIELLDQRLGQFARERHAPAVPARYRSLARRAATHIGRHVFHAHQLQYPPGKHQRIAGAQAGDERFFNTAQRFPAAALAPVFQLQVGIADDGADAHAVPPRQALAGHPPDPDGMGLDTLVIRVGAERVAAVADKVQRPLPLAVAQRAKGPGAAYFG